MEKLLKIPKKYYLSLKELERNYVTTSGVAFMKGQNSKFRVTGEAFVLEVEDESDLGLRIESFSISNSSSQNSEHVFSITVTQIFHSMSDQAQEIPIINFFLI